MIQRSYPLSSDGLLMFRFFILIKMMIQGQQSSSENLQNLPLSKILQKNDFCLEQFLSINAILQKVKREMRMFMNYCKKRNSFANQLINIGLKCPMHESNNNQMKNITYIASQILTSDNEAIADFLIISGGKKNIHSDDEEEIIEEIQSQETINQEEEGDQYRYLNQVLDYIQGENLDENCINYIAKCLQILIRKKFNAFLEYFSMYPEILAKLTQISHFPSVAHLLAKLITDDEENMTDRGEQARSKIVPLILQKIHRELHFERTAEVLESLEQILQSSRYIDSQQITGLQKLSNLLVSSEEVKFHLQSINNCWSKFGKDTIHGIFNSLYYLTTISARMNMDEQKDYEDSVQPTRQTLAYQLDFLFLNFCKLLLHLVKIEGSLKDSTLKLLVIKHLQLLSTLSKHSKFKVFYPQIPKGQRLSAITLLISKIAQRHYTGLVLQMASTLVEKILLQQQKIAQNHPQNTNKISPTELYRVIQQQHLHLEELVHELANEKTKQRNSNQAGIFMRKLLVIIDNFFKNSQIIKHFPQIQTITKLFPTFSPDNCKKYVSKATIQNHPSGNKARTPQQFNFIQRSSDFLKNIIVDEVQTELPPQSKVEDDARTQQAKLVFKLDGKIKTLKDRVKQRAAQKISEAIPLPIEPIKPETASIVEEPQPKIDSPSKLFNSPQPCLGFFIRHLAIY